MKLTERPEQMPEEGAGMSASPAFFGHTFTTEQVVAALDAFNANLPFKVRDQTAELMYRIFAAHVAIIDARPKPTNN